MNLPSLSIARKTGEEAFFDTNGDKDYRLVDFWSWNQSNLVENRTRGILAEYIIMKALDVPVSHRVEWDNYDIVTQNETRIEVKSAAYIQSWDQVKYSTISFGIASTVGAKDHPEYDGIPKRWADLYIFCLLHHQDQRTINPLDLSQWTFYILSTETLNRKRPKQKSVGLKSLLSLHPVTCGHSQLKQSLAAALQNIDEN